MSSLAKALESLGGVKRQASLAGLSEHLKVSLAY